MPGKDVAPLSATGAVSWGPNRIDVFVRGEDRAMWHIWWDSSAWRQVDSYVWTADPGSVGRLPQTIDLVERGTDGAAWLREISG